MRLHTCQNTQRIRIVAKLKAQEKAEKAAKADAKKQSEPKKCTPCTRRLIVDVCLFERFVLSLEHFVSTATKLEFNVEKFDQAAALKKIEGKQPVAISELCFVFVSAESLIITTQCVFVLLSSLGRRSAYCDRQRSRARSRRSRPPTPPRPMATSSPRLSD
jgi:hypothetical protein